MPNPRLVLAAALASLSVLGAACGKSGGVVVPGASTLGGEAPADLAYPAGLLVLAVGETLAPQLPTVTGQVSSWSISPALPAGMNFDLQTGGISGTPTDRTPLGLHLVEASNSQGSTSFPLGLHVTGESRFAYGASSVDGSLAIFGVESEGGALFHQGWLSASTSGVTALEADPHGRFVCAVDNFNLLSFLVDPISGQLSPGDAASLGSGPHSLAMHPGGDFVLATTRGSDRIRAFSVDPVTGELVQVSERFTGFQPNQVVVDPLGRFALVRHEFDATPGSEKTLLASYIIDAQSGVLTAGVSFDLLTTNATQMTLSPLGKNLYLTLSAPFPTVLHCSVNTTTGKPSLVGTADAGTTPVALRIDPRGERLYVVSQGSADVTLFDIDPLNGTLSAVTAFLAGATANALSFSDDGAELYVVDPVARDVTVHAIDPLTGESTSEETVRTRSGSSALTHIAGTQGIARRATDLYVANELSGDVASYSITQSTGELEDGNLPPLVAGTLPSGLVVDPLGRFVYVACAGSNEIVGFGIQGDGRLIDLMLPTPFAGGDPRHMAIDLAGRYLYVTVDFFDLLVAYSIQSDGSLVVHNSRALADDPESIVVDPTGTFVFITHAGNGTTELGEIASYAINSQNGNLTQLPSQDAPGHPASLAFNPAGTRAYVTFHDTDRVQPFDVSFSAGLTMIGAGSITQNEPREVELTRDGRFAFATFEDSISQGGLLLYDVNATTGELFNSDNQAFQWRDAVAAGVGPQLVEVTPDGAYVYVLAQTSEEIRAFTSDPVTGLTSALETESPGLVPIGMGLRVVIE